MTAGWDRGDEAARVRAIAAGKDEAWTEMHAHYGGVVFWHALLRTRHREEAEDLVQETYCRAHVWLRQAHREREPLPERLLPWLLRIADNLATDRARRLRTARHGGSTRFVPLDGASNVPDRNPGATAEDRIELERILRLIDGMPRIAQISLCLYLFEELSGREIARRLCVSKQKVFKALDRGLAQVRSELGAGHG